MCFCRVSVIYLLTILSGIGGVFNEWMSLTFQ